MRSSSPKTEEALFRRAQPWLGTLVAIGLEGEEEIAERAFEGAFAAIAAVHAAMSAHDEHSELSRLGRLEPGEQLALSPLLRRVLGAALALANASGGLFDPTLGGRQVERGRLPSLDLPPAHPAADWRDLVWHGAGKLSVRRRGRLDLGGIAKGFAIDRAIRALRRLGIRSAIVNAGGDLRTFGRIHEIRVRDPRDPRQSLPAAQIRDAAAASSGGYFSESDGESDLLDPRTGASLATRAKGEILSVTVCARRAIWADALTKVVLADEVRALPLLRRLGASALLLGRDGERRVIA